MSANSRTEGFKELYCIYIKAGEYDKASLVLSCIQQIEILQSGMGKTVTLTI